MFIVVCNNTATSKLVYEWISGFEREDEDGESRFRHAGHLELFRNYDEHGNRLTKFNTLLVDSEALESGEALDASYRDLTFDSLVTGLRSYDATSRMPDMKEPA